jgi:hypothetical protein
MKEAESDFEIEDVLSSIRRLVSQDGRAPRVQRASFRHSASAQDDNCLVLTPAQRIAQAQKPVVVAAAAPEAPAADIGEELGRLESAISEMEAAAAEAEIEPAAEPEAAVADFIAPKRPDAALADEADLDAGEVDENAEEPPPALTVDLPEFDVAEEAVPVFQAAEDVAAQEAAPELAAPETVSAILAMEVERFALSVASARPAADALFAGYEVVGPVEVDQAAEELADLPEPDAMETIEPVSEPEDMAAAVAVVLEADMEVEDVAESADACVAQDVATELEPEETPQVIERVAPQILRAESIRSPRLQVAEDEDPLFDAIAVPEFDEEALRIMVAQLIREELRGVLGERITHNVRKLVRREIQRALAGHELE